MLNQETKKKIDDLRQILVGKVTDPRSQVEQITNALLYKFMNDMDENSIALGGVASYFVNEYKKYSWTILLNNKTSGEDKVKIYSEALEKMYFNKNLPQTFREIFKNSTLPFKDAKVFIKFISKVNDFEYSNSESLGDAFEYLLSFMGKQGDAGQFRTPRHIIDFVVDLINPKKEDKILDPASGTAGFLISAYKHILNTNKKNLPGDLLNSKDRKNIANNLNGYDISPEFLKVSLMNMFLHKFNNPNIFEYDTLSDESKWNEYFDIILANPPFFSPKGGITPHNRFSIKSKRAEVLFTDYIDEHLKPNGRAGIIVPEGVIFRNDAGYKPLRIKLIKTSLVGIISLPAGIFEPYSGVKTSILILDKKLKKNIDYIYFGKINNDGFSLTTNRNPIDENDLPDLKSRLKELDFSDEKILKKIKKEKIFDGNIREHISESIDNKSIFEFKTLGEIAEIKSGNSAPQDKKFFNNGEFPFIRTSDVGVIKEGSIFFTRDYLNKDGIKNLKKFLKGSILFPKSGASTLLNHRVIMETDAYVSSHLAIIKGNEDKVLDKYLFYLLKRIDAKDLVANPSYPSLNLEEISKIEIPVPDLITQKQIIEELDEYQKIVDGCKQIINNYKPDIKFKDGWQKKKLKEFSKLTYGLGETAQAKGKYRYVRITDINEKGLLKDNEKKYLNIKKNEEKYILNKEDVLIARTGATYGKCLFFENNEPSVYAGYLIKLEFDKKVLLPKFFWIFSQSQNFNLQKQQLVVGGGQPQFNANTLGEIIVPIPSLEEQKEIINYVLEEQEIVYSNLNLIDKFQKKIKDKINSIWSN